MIKKIGVVLFAILLLTSGLLVAQDTTQVTLGKKPVVVQIEEEAETISQEIDNAFSPIVDVMNDILFWDPFAYSGIHDPIVYDEYGEPYVDDEGEPITSDIPFIVVWLIFGAVTFTIMMRFINFRGFKHSIQLIQGKYDDVAPF